MPDTQSATLSLSTDNYLTKVSKKDCAIFGPQFETFNRNLLISCQSRSRLLLPHELQYSAINILTLLQQSIKNIRENNQYPYILNGIISRLPIWEIGYKFLLALQICIQVC